MIWFCLGKRCFGQLYVKRYRRSQNFDSWFGREEDWSFHQACWSFYQCCWWSIEQYHRGEPRPSHIHRQSGQILNKTLLLEDCINSICFWRIGCVFAAFVNWWAWGWYNAMVEKLLWSSWSSQDIYYKIKCQADEEEEQRDSTRRKNPPVKAFWLFISFLFYFGLILCLSVFVFILYFDILIVPMNLCKK